jgi:hypothetical protein
LKICGGEIAKSSPTTPKTKVERKNVLVFWGKGRTDSSIENRPAVNIMGDMNNCKMKRETVLSQRTE